MIAAASCVFAEFVIVPRHANYVLTASLVRQPTKGSLELICGSRSSFFLRCYGGTLIDLLRCIRYVQHAVPAKEAERSADLFMQRLPDLCNCRRSFYCLPAGRVIREERTTTFSMQEGPRKIQRHGTIPQEQHVITNAKDASSATLGRWRKPESVVKR